MRIAPSFLFVVMLSVAGFGLVVPAPATSDTLAAASPVQGQTPPPLPDLPKDAAGIMAAAAPLYDFSAPGLKPWHMKVSYQLYDDDSKPTEQGTFEYWWGGPKSSRETWKRAGLEHTDWRVDGDRYQLAEGVRPGYFERELLEDFTTSLSAIAKQDQSRSGFHFELQKEKFGTVELPCVVRVPGVDRQLQPHLERNFQAPNTMYCFDPNHLALLLYGAPNGASVIYRNLLRIQGLVLPKELTVKFRMGTKLTATIESLEVIPANAAELKPPAGMEPLKRPVQIGVGSGVAVGMLKERVQPLYPQPAKAQGVQGIVVLTGTVGLDGKMHDLEVIGGISKDLDQAALDAVSRWVYKPYLLNGDPVEVDTTVNVVFSLGH